MPSSLQPSFSKGEISPSLYGRVGTSAFQTGLAEARNATIHSAGGVSNRAGLQFISWAKQHTAPPRLLKFEFNNQDTYVLEFGALYMRVIRNDVYVTETTVAITAATQINPVKVTAGSHGYANGDEVAIDNVVGMTELNGRRFIVANKNPNDFELTDPVDGTNIDGTGFGAWTSGGAVGKIFEIVTPYAQVDLDQLTYTQDANAITLTHEDHTTQELTRTAHDAWTLADMAFNPGQADPVGVTVTPASGAAVTERYRVTAISADDEESLPGLNNATETITAATTDNPVVLSIASHPYADGDEIEVAGIVGMTELNGRRFRVIDKTSGTIELRTVDNVPLDGTGFTAYTSGGTANRTFTEITNSAATKANTIAWTEVAGAVRYAIYNLVNGLYGLVGESETASFLDSNIAPDIAEPPPRYSEPFFGAGNQPAGSGYFEQRRVLGGSLDKPNSNFFSKTAFFNNFTKTVPVRVDDAIEARLVSQKVNQIRHFVALNDLLVFTDGAEWRVDAGADVGFSIETIRQKPQSAWGSSYRQPITVGNTVLFVQPGNTSVRSIGYAFSTNSYAGADLSILASHMLRQKTIVDWAFAKSPDPVVYMVRSDGDMICMTFDQEQEVIAWSTWDTDGKFERVTAVQSSPGSRDESAYFVVSRKVNGNRVRYIEKLHSRNFEDIRDAFFIDSGLSKDVSIDIAGLALTNPVRVSIPAHGLTEGDAIDIFDVEWETDLDADDTETQPVLADGAPQLNTRRFLVSNIGQSNLFTFSEEIDNAVWTKGTSTISANVGLDPLTGTTTTDKWIPDNLSTTAFLSMVPGASEALPLTKYTVSVYVKDAGAIAAGIKVIRLLFQSDEINAFAFYNIDTGAITSPSGDGFNAAVNEDIGNGWRRISLTGTWASSVTTASVQIAAMADGTGDGVVGFEYWGAQLEASAEAGTYVKVEGTEDRTGDDFELTDEEGAAIDGTAYNAYVEGGTVRVATDSVSGLAHLIGKTVQILADGNVEPEQVVASDGTLALTSKFSRVHAGLKYVTDIRTLNIEVNDAHLVGRMKKVSRVVAKVDRTRGVTVGPREGSLTEIPFRDQERMNDPTEALSGTLDVILKSSWNTNGQLLFRQRYPLPLTLLSVSPEFEAGR